MPCGLGFCLHLLGPSFWCEYNSYNYSLLFILLPSVSCSSTACCIFLLHFPCIARHHCVYRPCSRLLISPLLPPASAKVRSTGTCSTLELSLFRTPTVDSCQTGLLPSQVIIGETPLISFSICCRALEIVGRRVPPPRVLLMHFHDHPVNREILLQ